MLLNSCSRYQYIGSFINIYIISFLLEILSNYFKTGKIQRVFVTLGELLISKLE